MLELKDCNVCPRIPLRKGLPGATGGSDTRLVHASGWALHARVSGRAQAVFADRDLQAARSCG